MSWDVTGHLYHPVNADKSYGLSFPEGCFGVCCGASHGWLILANDLSNLVLYNPVTLAMIPLPPVTDFACVKAVSGGYSFGTSTSTVYKPNRFAIWFYQKAVLSCSPSKVGDYIAMIIHYTRQSWVGLGRTSRRIFLVDASRVRPSETTGHTRPARTACASVRPGAGAGRTRLAGGCGDWQPSAEAVRRWPGRRRSTPGRRGGRGGGQRGGGQRRRGGAGGAEVVCSVGRRPAVPWRSCSRTTPGGGGGAGEELQPGGARRRKKIEKEVREKKEEDYRWGSQQTAGQSKWQVASTLSRRDRYLDCAYHKGRFYAVTLNGMVEKWDLDGANGPTREVLVAARPHPGCILSRHLVSAPWGDLLQVRAKLANNYPDGIAFEIYKVVPDGCEVVVQENVLEDHVLFLGLNHSACLPTQNLPGIRRHCIYFSAPVIIHVFDFLLQLRVWGGVRTYDLERGKFERAVPFCDVKELIYGVFPSEVWITQNM
ncbi:hypothetical protein SETIT_7G199200v2 [Setaria italica]|uniref:KIB1-4 beta-propeller domain-containing protein n=1 Tax=Setaria italica TaxID=4555 RepID=A0A368RXL3_SETIT|nr:hypothetical protein SETIT_7G199200v2 [Setaria italica]